MRSYLLIACTTPYMVFFGHGYARLTLSLYDPHASDLGGHLTNQVRAPQRKGPSLQPWTRSLPSNAEEMPAVAQTGAWPSLGSDPGQRWPSLGGGPGTTVAQA